MSQINYNDIRCGMCYKPINLSEVDTYVKCQGETYEHKKCYHRANAPVTYSSGKSAHSGSKSLKSVTYQKRKY